MEGIVSTEGTVREMGTAVAKLRETLLEIEDEDLRSKIEGHLDNLDDAVEEARERLAALASQTGEQPALVDALRDFANWQWGGYREKRDERTFRVISAALWGDVVDAVRRTAPEEAPFASPIPEESLGVSGRGGDSRDRGEVQGATGS